MSRPIIVDFRQGDHVYIGDAVTVALTSIKDHGVRGVQAHIGIDAPLHVAIVRSELVGGGGKGGKTKTKRR